MIKEQDVTINEEQSGPNLVKLSDGSYIQWDKNDRFYRVAYFQRRAEKGFDLETTIAQAMKKPVHNSKVRKIFEFISGTEAYATASS